MKILITLLFSFLAFNTAAETPAATQLPVTDADFNCMLDMQPVRGFYVDNLIPGKLDETLTVANAGSGEYPAGSVVQLVPTEVMVKHPAGFSPATKDWEFLN